MTAEPRYQVKAHIVATEMDGETVALDADQGLYFGIGGIGPRIWELLQQPRTLTALVDVIHAEYEVDRAQCEAELRTFLDALVDNGVIETV